MALLAVIGFDHLEGQANWFSLLDSLMSTANTGSPSPRAIVTGGWLGSADLRTTPTDQLLIPLRTLAKPGATKVTVGVRCRADAVAGQVFASIAGNSAVRGIATAGAAGYTALSTAGAQVYAEFEIPLSGPSPIIIKRWVNGQPVVDQSVTDVLQASGGNLVLSMKNLSGGCTAFRDIYILDDTGTEFNTRLGPRKIVPVTFDACSAPNWTYTSGSVLAAISTPGEDPTVNKATSPLTKDPLTAGLHATVETGAEIQAIALALGGKSISTANVTMGAKLKNGSNELPLINPVLTTTQGYNNNMGILTKAPNGAAWTSALLESTDLVITPDIGA